MNGVSIIIPTKGVPVFLDECVNSILKNNIDFPFEILIGIDSCHETIYHIEKDKIFYKKTKIFYFDSHVGPYVIKNSLVGIANYEYILFFDSDDIMTENMLNNFYNEIDHVDFVRFNYLNFSKNINNLLNENLKSDTIIGTKKTILDKIVGFQPWFCGADSELYERLVFNKMTEKTIDGLSFYRRIHDKNLTIRKETSNRSEIRKKYLDILKENKTKNIWTNPEKRVTEEYRKIKFDK